MVPNSPNLRRRHLKNGDGTSTDNPNNNNNEEAKPLLDSSLEPSESSFAETKKNVNSGYKLEPLVERSVLMRLDVGPFLLLYSILIGLDFVEHDRRLYLNYFDYLFPVVLASQLALFFMLQWSVGARALVGFQPARNIASMTHCLVEAPQVDKHHAAHDDGIVPATKSDDDGVVIVKFRDVIFRSPTVSFETDTDVALWKLDDGAPEKSPQDNTFVRSFHRLRYPIYLPLDFYKNWRGFQQLPTLVQAQKAYGTNTTPIELPPFLSLLQEQVVAPFFLFQLLCVVLWSLDEYWYYAIFTFFALLMFEATVAFNRLQSLQRLRSHTVNQRRTIFVYRPAYPVGKNGWTQVLVSELVPGDIVSCKHYSVSQERNRRKHPQEQQLNGIAADILVLSGDAVVDEALLTGESIPQLKGALSEESSNGNLNLQEHKECILFGGTTMLVANAGGASNGIPASPDNGVIGMVLRTGFETAQGSLLRTLAHTQKSVDGIHTRDTYAFIFILLCCAVASAGMVLQEGWNDPTRNRFRLLLHVVIIITSVVPPELPMELSLAVTNSVASLMKDCQVYCTEVFRIPLAGQVTICCFDKTGTLTSDEMQLVGVRHLDESGNFNEKVARPDSELPWPVARIMVACHSLALNVTVGSSSQSLNKVIGDPLEKAVLKNTGYQLAQNNALRAVEPLEGRPGTILVLHRFRFSSTLKRMSVVVREDSSTKTWVLSKGAPETIKSLLDPQFIPETYDEISTKHMALGQRVLAIAYREINKEEISSSNSLMNLKRETAERGLRFAGFLLLDCPVKPDSKPVISELLSTGHKCFMITGDALLTAAAVARQVGIIRNNQSSRPHLYEIKRVPANVTNAVGPEAFSFVHLSRGSNDDGVTILNGTLSLDSLRGVKEMVESGRVALCLSGETLDDLGRCIVESEIGSALASHLPTNENQILFHPSAQHFLKELVPIVAVYARHAPRQKEAIIAAFNAAGHTTLMCGDGTNDVGALRRANVGISLISAPEVEAKQRAASEAMSRERTQQKKARKEGKRRSKPASFEESLRQLREAQEELDSVELGDASIASPFTSRAVSIKCCKDVLQQGRCTLVTMLQIYKILGVNCLVNATGLSKLFLHGVKNGDRQMTILGVGVATLFFLVTRGKPLRTLSVTRPPASVLCTQALLSVALQFLVHLGAILLSAQAALAFVDPYDPSMIPDGPFNPNTLNSCTFLLTAIATVNTFAINYRGEPFMESLWQNRMLLRSLQVCYVVLFGCAFEVFPPLNDLLQLTEMPVLDGTQRVFATPGGDGSTFLQPILHSYIGELGFPGFLALLMVLDTLLALAAERAVLRLFEPTTDKIVS